MQKDFRLLVDGAKSDEENILFGEALHSEEYL